MFLVLIVSGGWMNSTFSVCMGKNWAISVWTACPWWGQAERAKATQAADWLHIGQPWELHYKGVLLPMVCKSPEHPKSLSCFLCYSKLIPEDKRFPSASVWLVWRKPLLPGPWVQGRRKGIQSFNLHREQRTVCNVTGMSGMIHLNSLAF